MFCGRPEFKAIFRRREGENLYSKNKDIISSFNLHGGIKNKLECITIWTGEEEGLQTPKK